MCKTKLHVPLNIQWNKHAILVESMVEVYVEFGTSGTIHFTSKECVR